MSANARNYMAKLINGESFGGEDFSMTVNAMLDEERYQQASMGTLDGGLTYEDYKSNKTVC